MCVVPVKVVSPGVVDDWSARMPNAHVWKDDRLHDCLGVNGSGYRRHIASSNAHHHSLEVLGSTTQPMLQREHKGPGILCLITGQEFEHLRKGAHKLQQAVLKVAATLFGLVLLQVLLPQIFDLLSKVPQGTARNLSQVKAAQLVHLHDLWHGWEAKTRIQVVPARLHNLDQLLRKLLDKNERANEDVCVIHILLQLGNLLWVADLLKQVAHAFHADAAPALVDGFHG
mmetsp:Transcript_61007/g.108460  ORF Transcript_61007/g.108460 Transcript_61007/m.108460 type:complete len:228 (-) Transcript_61007:587-1270(-)